MPQVQSPIIISEIIMASTKRHRFGRTGLIGCFHFKTDNTRLAGAATTVKGYIISVASGRISATESNIVNDGFSRADATLPPVTLPCIRHVGHSTSLPNSTEQNWQTKRPHRWQA